MELIFGGGCKLFRKVERIPVRGWQVGWVSVCFAEGWRWAPSGLTSSSSAPSPRACNPKQSAHTSQKGRNLPPPPPTAKPQLLKQTVSATTFLSPSYLLRFHATLPQSSPWGYGSAGGRKDKSSLPLLFQRCSLTLPGGQGQMHLDGSGHIDICTPWESQATIC